MQLSKLNRMYILSFFFSLHIALSAYVNSTFLTKIISEKYVGLLFTISSIVTFVSLSKSSSILKYFGNRKLILWLLMINMLSIVGLITLSNPYVIGLAFVSLLTTNTLVFLCLDIFIEHYGDKNTIGKTRGFYLTILNLGWVLSPLITGMLISKEGGYIAIYTISFIATVIMTIGLFFSIKTFEDKQYEKIPLIESLKYLKNNRHMMAITTINFILQFFFAWMIVYTPIYLLKHIGFMWGELGIVFTVMLIPFIIFGLPIGYVIDTYHVKKRTLILLGFIIMGLSTLLISFITIKSVVIWAIVLFLTRTGAAIIETTSEIYFFTHIKEEEAYLLGIFRDMTPVAYIIAPLLGTILLIFLPFKSLFLILGLIIFSGIYFIPKLKHDHEHSIPNTN